MNQRRLDRIENLRRKVQESVNVYLDRMYYLEPKIEEALDTLTEEEKDFLGYHSVEDVTRDVVVPNIYENM